MLSTGSEQREKQRKQQEQRNGHCFHHKTSIRDKHDLKGPRTAYILFAQDKRPQVMEGIARRAVEDPLWFNEETRKISEQLGLNGPKDSEKNESKNDFGEELDHYAFPRANSISSRVGFALATKEVAALWQHVCDNDRPEFERYTRLAEHDKQRYLVDKANHSEALLTKKPGAPLFTRSAYAFFLKSMAEKRQGETSKHELSRMSAENSKMWRALSAEAKAPYLAMRDADRERYQRELADWRANQPEQEKAARKAFNKRKREQGRPKKPRSAFVYFTKEQRPGIVASEEHRGKSFGELSKVVAAAYRCLSADEKKRYVEMHDKDRKRYIGEMTAWKS